MFIIKDFIARARSSLSGAKRPKSVFLRRAVSDAYYGLFHAIAFLCADTLVGITKRNSDAWRRVYRTLDHGKAKNEFQRPEGRALDPAITRIGTAFVQLQEERHKTDYDPSSTLRRRSDAEPWVSQVQASTSNNPSNPDMTAEELRCRLCILTLPHLPPKLAKLANFRSSP